MLLTPPSERDGGKCRKRQGTEGACATVEIYCARAPPTAIAVPPPPGGGLEIAYRNATQA